MGLDFTIYAKNKDEKVDDVELAYGRKSWELVHFLNLNANDEFDVPVKREDWDRLIEAMKPIGDKFEDVWKAFDKWENLGDIDFPEFILTDEDKKLIAEYEFWHTKTFNESPYLGYDFSVGYMLNFWEARDNVNYYFNHPENWEVRASISY